MKDTEIVGTRWSVRQRYRARRHDIICSSYLPNCSIATVWSHRSSEETSQCFSPPLARLYWHLKLFTIARLNITKLKYLRLPQPLKLILQREPEGRQWIDFYSYPTYERILIVDLNKDTKTIIIVVPTGSNPDLSQEQPTENQCQCLWVHIPVFFFFSYGHAVYSRI